METITYTEYLDKAYKFYVQKYFKDIMDKPTNPPVDKETFEKTNFTNSEYMTHLMGYEYIDLSGFDNENKTYVYPDTHMHTLKIRLETETDATEFVNIMQKVKGKAILTGKDDDADSVTVNAKSIMGVLYTMKWVDVTLKTDTDVYLDIAKYVI